MSGRDSPTFFHGQPWSSWVEKIGRDRPLSDDEQEDEAASSVMRLATDDIDLFGFCPKTDNFYGVICETCNAVIKPQALVKHMEMRHPTSNPVSFSSSANQANSQLNSVKAMIKTPYCKLSKLKKSQMVNHTAAGSAISANAANSSNSKTNAHQGKQKPITDLQQYNSLQPGSPHESVPTQQTSGNLSNSLNSKSPCAQPKRKKLKTERSLLKDREYDADKHCGVWNEETGKPCTRSLTCKAHTVSLRRTVAGRSKPFDKLLAEHRASKETNNNKANTAKLSNSNNSTPTATTQLTPTISVSNAESALAPSTPSSNTELEAPSSPPVLSLPDTFPLPQAVDYLYEISYPKMAPHGIHKTTKLEEEFSKEAESTHGSEQTSVNSNIIANSNNISSNNNIISNATSTKSSVISTVLPSLSPIETENLSPQYTTGFITRNSPMSTMVTQQNHLKQSDKQSPVSNYSSAQNVIYDTRPTPMDVDQSITIYPSSAFTSNSKDTLSNSQMTVQIPRSSQINSRGFINLFNTTAQHQLYDPTFTIATNGNNHYQNDKGFEVYGDYTQNNLQTEQAIEPPTTYTTFGDINWSQCHPEPLAASTWLNFSANKKQFSWNIH